MSHCILTCCRLSLFSASSVFSLVEFPHFIAGSGSAASHKVGGCGWAGGLSRPHQSMMQLYMSLVRLWCVILKRSQEISRVKIEFMSDLMLGLPSPQNKFSKLPTVTDLNCTSQRKWGFTHQKHRSVNDCLWCRWWCYFVEMFGWFLTNWGLWGLLEWVFHEPSLLCWDWHKFGQLKDTVH